MLILLGVVVAGVAVLGWAALAGGVMGEEERHRPGRLGGTTASLGITVVGGAVLVIVIAGAVVMVGVRGSGEDGAGPQPAPGDAPAEEAPLPEATEAPGQPDDQEPGDDRGEVPAGGSASAHLGPLVRLTGVDLAVESDGFPAPPAVIDELEDGTVLQVRVSGFPPFAQARAEQCATTTEGTACRNLILVQFGEDGRAHFQYLVTADAGGALGADLCGPGGPLCTLVVRDVEGAVRAARRTVFGGEAPAPAEVVVEPRVEIDDGDVVNVVVSGLPAGAAGRAVLCVAPATGGPEGCGPPGPVAQLRAGADGRAATEMTIHTGPVGTSGARCGRGSTCGVAVLTDRGAVGRVVPIGFAGPPGPDYHGGRLAGGLAAAAVLLGALAWIVRRTDWSPVGEAAAPEIDEAEHADLDAIVAALPAEEAELELDDLLRR